MSVPAMIRKSHEEKPPAARGATPESIEKRLFRVMPYGILRFNEAAEITDANPAALAIYGLTRKELFARPVSDPRWQFLDERGAPLPVFGLTVMRAMRTRKVQRNRIIGVFSEKVRRHVWLNVDVIPQFLPDGRVREYWVIFHDITEARNAAKALQESQSNLELAQRVTATGSAVLKFDGGQWEWSSQMYRLHGLSPDEFDPRIDDVAEFVHPDDRETYLQGEETARAGLEPYPFEYRLVMRDGTVRVVSREASLIRSDPKGRVSGVIFTHTDVTERRNAEREREQLQQQLYHAQRLDSLGTLASGIAHDLNNTLVPVLGLTEALLAGHIPMEQALPMLRVIEKAGQRARDLVRQVLDFSRKERPQFSAFDLAAAVRDTMLLARASIPTTIDIVEEISEVSTFRGDATQLHQVLLNLLANASQAIGDKKGTITVRLRRKGPAAVELSVEDTGLGIEIGIQKRIFEPFFTTRPVGSGTGLGLSVVHGIVRSHGGTIDVESAPGRGACFTINLPT
ncbi:MAG: PAS domain S-box protein [Alphaproteobacteria bacterium]|nr:PAS domain S-box protein [Alphaproteobacteria bacterium]MBV9903102.1 PAS domain S-box protein [Alphaproteobacteria bacterium]